MKHVREIVSEYLDHHPEEFEKGHNGVLVPEGAEERMVAEWLEQTPGLGGWACGLRGATRADACWYACKALCSLSHGADEETARRVTGCVDAFADWEQELSKGPEEVLRYCEWMRVAAWERCKDPETVWPWVALEVMLCELAILSYHRLDVADAEQVHGMNLLNVAMYFQAYEGGGGSPARKKNNNEVQ